MLAAFLIQLNSCLILHNSITAICFQNEVYLQFSKSRVGRGGVKLCNWQKSVYFMLTNRHCCICRRGILALLTSDTSGYKMGNPFPTGSTIAVAITWHNFQQWLATSVGSCAARQHLATVPRVITPCRGPTSQLPRSTTGYWWILLSPQSPHDPVSNQKCHTDQIARGICARNHTIPMYMC